MESGTPTTVADVIRLLEGMAPPSLAEAWDNCGLQVGALDRPVEHVWVALDPSPEVVDAACRDDADLLITHHPLIFKPLKRIDLDAPDGRTIARAIRADLSIYAAHTSLDSAEDGLNDLLARRLGVMVAGPLEAAFGGKVEGSVGLGRIGQLAEPMSLVSLAHQAGHRLGMEQVPIVGDPEAVVQTVALCSGSGGSLVGAFLASPARVFITGEIRYHDARDILAAGRAAIDIGHFASERIMIDDIVARLGRALGTGRVRLTACTLERDPFGRVQVRSQANK